MRHEDVHFEKKKVSDEQRKKEECSQSKRSTCKKRACKIFAPKRQQKIVCSVIALLAMACHGSGYMLVFHVVLIHSRKRLVAKRRLSWRRTNASVACGACSFAVAKTWNSAGYRLTATAVWLAMCLCVLNGTWGKLDFRRMAVGLQSRVGRYGAWDGAADDGQSRKQLTPRSQSGRETPLPLPQWGLCLDYPCLQGNG